MRQRPDRFHHPAMRAGLGLALLLLVAGCAAQHRPPATAHSRPAEHAARRMAAGPGVKIGKPYTVLGQTYEPRDEPDYAEEGVASWYGPGFHEKMTANGEFFDQNSLSAAHRTLPLPSYVEVTNLQNRRTVVVRINDRGPFVKDRIIDLSRRAAQLLGFDQTGTARVLVRRVYPAVAPAAPAGPPVVMASAPPAAKAPELAARAPEPPARPGPTTPMIAVIDPLGGKTAPPATTATAAAAASASASQSLLMSAVYVQVAALSDAARANALSIALKPFGAVEVATTDAGLRRVMVGPFLTRDAADMVLASLRAAGYEDARVLSRPTS